MEIQHNFGVVAILDALGISNLDESEGVNYIEARDKAIEQAKKRAERNKSIIQTLAKFNENHQYDEIINSANPIPRVLSINDTVIFSWPIKLDRDNNLDDHLTAFTLRWVADFLAIFLAVSLAFDRIKYRGALSVNFFADIENGSIMGKAVSDAATLYSAHDHIGVIITPNSTAFIDRLIEGNSYYASLVSDVIDDDCAFMKASVKLKNGHALPLWTVPWPAAFSSIYRIINEAKNKTMNPRQSFIAQLWSDEPPLEAQQKCFAALEYYDLCQSYLSEMRERDA